ncbi:peroxiredoxin [Cellvibrio fontiphilus]|uniref:thioredoxin-dependent peroxiredoxin n=1 Tax=Cellvibrio fontiphilus TaxID=1815559 RepID=A0ABV7FCW5_9GAMM
MKMMNKLILTSLFAGVLSLPVNAALEAGAQAPLFTLEASLAGKAFQFSLQEKLTSGPVVVYFYPSAYTNGCNIQAHTFSVNADKFAAAGATVIGVSLDSIERLNEFSADPEYCAGKFAVGSDVGGKVAKAFELNVRDAVEGKVDSRGKAIKHGFAERTTFVITQDGKIAATIGGVTPAENVKAALEKVQQLAKTSH